MHGCTSGSMLLVNAELDSMGGVEINSTPSLQQSSDLEKTQAELRQTFTTAETFRRELEFLQKGGDPLDLKPGNAASISFQSTSLPDRHPQQFVTSCSEAKGSFAITASPHGDSVESSGRLGAPLSCEPNSADNLMLLKESGDSTVLEIPKKAYKRRVRSRPNRDPFRHVSRDFKGSTNDSQERKNCLLNSNSNPKSPNELDGVPAVQSTLVPETKALVEPEFVGNINQVNLSDSKCPTPINGFGNTEETKNIPDPTKILDAESSCTQNSQRFDDFNANGQTERSLEGGNIVAEKNDKILNIHSTRNEDCAAIKEEEDIKGRDLITENNRPQGSEQNACSQENLKLAVKEHEDSILEEARIIEAKRKRIDELCVRTPPPEKRLKSQWDFVLEEMQWLANDFAQERLWKVTAAAQISQKVAFASRVRLQQQISLQKHKEVSHTLAEAVMQFWHMIQVKCKEPESECIKKDDRIGVEGYAMRFLEYNDSCQVQWDPIQPHVSDSDLVSMDLSWEDNLTEENLFYTVPPGAIEAYRKAIDSHLLQFERSGSSMQEEVDTSGYDAVADNAFEEDEGETSTYYLPGPKSTNTAQKRRKNFKFYGPNSKSYEMGFMQSVEKTVGNQLSVLSGKRSGNSLIPTKRVRTASRQRIMTPFSAGTSGQMQPLNRTDASSGDNNSFQDEQSILQNNMEAESVGDYEKQLQFDSMEVSNRPKKKKKGSMFENRWQLDSNFQNDQKDHARRRLDTHQFDSNGSSVASQMSNMSNPNKFMKLLVRDRGRKVKPLKNPVGQPDSGSPWSLFEDQALVVLVHDMGPNWELISDAINSTLQFKCIFRKSKECKERHSILMDRNTGDGVDSAEDSGSSQPYPSTLPGIPEGSARQLFQRLQGPMEEDTLKSHFEKIIMIGQKQHYRRTHNDNQDPKQLQQPHKSHANALSQVYPNNKIGGPVLTPLELCEAISSSPDVVPVGYQGPHSGASPGSNHGSVPPMAPGSGSASVSATSAPGSNLSSSSAPLNPSVREGRYGIPRTGSLSVEDQQRIQQYNQMLSARNSKMLPAGNGTGTGGVNRNMKMTRPGFPSTSMLNSAQGNSMLRPRDPMHIVRAADQQSGPPFPNQIPQQSYPRGPISPHFQGPPNNTQNPALAMRFAKERQLQQRLLLQQQQHHQFSTSNPMMPPVQQDSQLPLSSPQPSSSPPVRPPPPPHGLVRNPQIRPRMPHQLPPQQRQQPPPQLMKGSVRGNMMTNQNLSSDSSSLVNGFSGGQSTKMYPAVPQSGLSQPHQHKTFSGQTHKSTQSSDDNNNKNQNLVSKRQAVTTPQKVLLNRKVNTSDQSTSQTNTAVTTPNEPSNSTETPVVSSGKNPVRVGVPQASGVGTESEKSGAVMSQVMVHRQSSLDNSVGNDEGVQWQPPS